MTYKGNWTHKGSATCDDMNRIIDDSLKKLAGGSFDKKTKNELGKKRIDSEDVDVVKNIKDLLNNNENGHDDKDDRDEEEDKKNKRVNISIESGEMDERMASKIYSLIIKLADMDTPGEIPDAPQGGVEEPPQKRSNLQIVVGALKKIVENMEHMPENLDEDEKALILAINPNIKVLEPEFDYKTEEESSQAEEIDKLFNENIASKIFLSKFAESNGGDNKNGEDTEDTEEEEESSEEDKFDFSKFLENKNKEKKEKKAGPGSTTAVFASLAINRKREKEIGKISGGYGEMSEIDVRNERRMYREIKDILGDHVNK